MTKILVTGTGRSGTTFAATTLLKLGISAGHERIYQIGRKGPDWPKHDHVEVSWAAPRFRADWPEDVTVLHLVRHPLRTVESYLNIIPGAYAGWIDRWHLPEMVRPSGLTNVDGSFEDMGTWSKLDWVAWHYITWNRCVERYASRLFRVEDGDGKRLFVHIANLLKFNGQMDLVEARKQANRNSVNPGANTARVEDMAPRLQQPFLAIMRDYGYDS
jgi:hypothetical protein